MLTPNRPDSKVVCALPLRLLAHLGDAVFDLFEREREILSVSTAKELHARVSARVRAEKQAELLQSLLPALGVSEKEIVRRARNLKLPGQRKPGQLIYRQATAFEALIGYLYLTSPTRLRQILSLTAACPPEAPTPGIEILKDRL